MDHHQTWLEEHGFYCAALRSTLTPKACADNRAKPAWGEEGYTTSHYRPTPCHTCQDWERLCAGSAGKEEDMGAKKQGTCVMCGEVKPIAARGLCWACYDKERPDPSDDAGSNKICTACGERPVSSRGLCRRCYDQKRNSGKIERVKPYKPRKKRPDDAPPAPPAPPTGTMSIDSDGKLRIDVNFSLAPDVHKQLLELAKDEVRDPDKQIIWLLKNLFRKAQAIGGGI